MHQSREGLPNWFEAEGFEPAIDPDGDAWRVMIHPTADLLPTADRPTGRVVCEVRDLPDVRVAVHLAAETGELVALEVGDAALVMPGPTVGELRPISARLLRKIPFGDVEQAARDHLRWELAVRYHHDEPVVRASLDDGGQRLRESLAGRPGKRGRDDVPYAKLAAEYVRRLGQRAPVKALAQDIGYDSQTVSNKLNEARRRGLLTRPAPGKSGGQLTRKALDLLSQEENT